MSIPSAIGQISHELLPKPWSKLRPQQSSLRHKSSQYFLRSVVQEIEIKAENKQMEAIKLTSFCTAKETIIKTKRHPTEREKIFANDGTDKGLSSKM